MKKYFVIAALLLTTGLIFAFQYQPTQPQPQAEALTQVWYDFISGDETDPNRYELREEQTDPTCVFGDDMCAVKALPHSTLSGKPNLADPNIEVRRQDLP